MDPAMNDVPTPGNHFQSDPSTPQNSNSGGSQTPRSQTSEYRRRVIRFRRRERRRRTQNPPHLQPAQRRRSRRRASQRVVTPAREEEQLLVEEEPTVVDTAMEDVAEPAEDVDDGDENDYDEEKETLPAKSPQSVDTQTKGSANLVQYAASVESAELGDVNAFWPDVLEALRRRHLGQPTGPVKCAICSSSHLVIDGIEGPLDDTEQEAAGITQEIGVLLGCGHVFGEGCLWRWRLVREREDEPFTCPICRFDLDPPRCRSHELDWWEQLHDEDESGFWIIAQGLQPSGDPHRAAAEACTLCQSLLPPPADDSDEEEDRLIHIPPINQHPNTAMLWVQREPPPDPLPDGEARVVLEPLELDLTDLEGSRERVWDLVLELHNREMERRGGN